MAQCTNDQSQVQHHSAIQAPHAKSDWIMPQLEKKYFKFAILHQTKVIRSERTFDNLDEVQIQENLFLRLIGSICSAGTAQANQICFPRSSE